jgi:glycosyltransferase involved in cell wall biosynthesis
MNYFSDFFISKVLVKFTREVGKSQLRTTAFMRIAIIHYHLYPGGVTRVIESQVGALADFVDRDSLTVYAGDIHGWDNLYGNSISVKEETVFQYLPEKTPAEKIQEDFQEIMLCLQKIARGNDILHVHNLNLGKNPLLTLAVYRMAREGIRIVNHCHDFAEDRPGNYAFLQSVIRDVFHENLHEVLYPSFENVHSIVLTSKDYERLTRYGIVENRISLLPNPVSLHRKGSDRIPKETVKEQLGIDPVLPVCIYPVRAIHRKNIGEFILLSVLFRKSSWLITQPPRNPVEKPEYESWKKFCRDQSIAVIFEAGNRVELQDLLPASDYCVTTSVMEGFGLAYLEPWLESIPVIGRNIEYCTVDLKRNGFRFPLLYDRFIVSFKGEKKDFKDLDQQQQQQVIQEIITLPAREDEIRVLNPFLEDFLKPADRDIIRNNQQVIREKYSPESYGLQVYGIYKKLFNGS